MAARSIEPYRDRVLPERFHRWIEILRNRIKTIPCYFQGAGSPEGVIVANTGDRYYDETNDTLYIKSTDGVATGWLAVGGGAAASTSQLLVAAPLRSTGADTAINFSSSDYDPTNSRYLVGGNNSFVGSMASARLGKVVQAAALPSTVIANGSIADMNLNNTDAGVLVRIANQMARANTAMSAWTAITPPFAVTYSGLTSWKGTQLVALHTRQSGPSRDYTVSTDNGATWPAQFFTGISAGTTLRTRFRKSLNDGKLGVIGASSKFAWTASADLTVAVWNVFDFVASISLAGNGNDMDWNADGSRAVYVTDNGDVAVTVDGGLTWSRFDRNVNLFRNGASSFSTIQMCVYVAALDGWLLLHPTTGAFIPSTATLDEMYLIHLGMVAAPSFTNASRATDGTDVLFPANTNNAVMLLD